MTPRSPGEARADAVEADAALTALARTGEESARLIETAFDAASRSIAGALGEAARAGELSFQGLFEALARDLAGLAARELIARPLGRFADAVERGGGGGGSAASSGGLSAGAVTVIINTAGEAVDGVRRSERQIAAAVARAALAGRRSL